VTHTAECFYCHKCGWKGNAVTLQRELGIYRRIPSTEYRELCVRRERAHEAAQRLYWAAHARQLELREELRELGRAELLAHDLRADAESTWEILSHVYTERPRMEADLDALESGDPAAVLASLKG
jgi:hypothetical protein